MRKQIIFRRISVTEEVYQRIHEDRKHFQETINGGKWSVSDTITEWLKIINTK